MQLRPADFQVVAEIPDGVLITDEFLDTLLRAHHFKRGTLSRPEVLGLLPAASQAVH